MTIPSDQRDQERKSPPKGSSAFARLRERVTDRERWPRRWWWPPGLADSALPEEDRKRQHDELSMTIRRAMMTLVAYSFFCLFTLGQPDAVLLEGRIKIPFADITVDFFDFLIIGPLILIAFAAYMHIFIGSLNAVRWPEPSKALPFLFNLPGGFSKLITWLLFYGLVPFVLWKFAQKAGPHGARDPLFLLFIVVTVVLMGLWIRRTPEAMRRRLGYRVRWGVLLVLFLPVLVTADGWRQVGQHGTVALRSNIPFLSDQVTLASLPPPGPPKTVVDENLAAAPSVAPPPASPTGETARLATAPRAREGARLETPPVPATVSTLPPQPTYMNAAKIAQTILGLDRNLDLAGADLRKVDLSKRDLSRADLSRARLEGVDLSRRNLTGTNLSRAKLAGADLNGADLTEARLVRANLASADLTFASLNFADLRGAVLSKADLEGATLESARMEGAFLNGANLQRAILRKANLKGAHLDGADLTRAHLNGAHGLRCEQLRSAKNWEKSFRDNELACDEPIPSYPAK